LAGTAFTWQRLHIDLVSVEEVGEGAVDEVCSISSEDCSSADGTALPEEVSALPPVPKEVPDVALSSDELSGPSVDASNLLGVQGLLDLMLMGVFESPNVF